MNLKPCPFCGGRAMLSTTHQAGTTLTQIVCVNCGALGQRIARPPVFEWQADVAMSEAAKKQAEEAWNKRSV